MTIQNNRLPKLDTYVYLAYVFFMPLGRFIYRPKGMPLTIETMSMSTIVMLIGVMLMFRHKNWKASKGIRAFILLYVFMALYSLIAACIIYTDIPIFHGRNVLFAPAENIVNYGITLLSICYNYNCLSRLGGFVKFRKAIDASIVLVLFVGYLQLGALSGLGVCVKIYNILSYVLYLCPLQKILGMERGVTGFGSEPSSFANMFYIVIPYLVVSIKYQWAHRRRHILMLVMFAVLFWGSGSSSVVIMLFLAIGTAICVFVYPRLLRTAMIGAFAVGLMIAVMYSVEYKVDTVNDGPESIEYRVYGKIVDRKNYSTMMRSSNIAVDMKLLVEYPITGVGLGLQGLWFEDLLPSWTRKSDEVQYLLKDSSPIVNGGGAFFPAYFSGFGLIGLIALVMFFGVYRNYMRIFRKYPSWYGIYAMGLVGAILSMWYVASPKMNEYICFLLVIPLALSAREHKSVRNGNISAKILR